MIWVAQQRLGLRELVSQFGNARRMIVKGISCEVPVGIGPNRAPRPFNHSERTDRPEAPRPDKYANVARFVACATCRGRGFLVLFDEHFPDDPPTRPYCCSCMGEGFVDTEQHQQSRGA